MQIKPSQPDINCCQAISKSWSLQTDGSKARVCSHSASLSLLNVSIKVFMQHSLLRAYPKEPWAYYISVFSALKNGRKPQFSILNLSFIIYHLTIFFFWLMTLGFWGKVDYECKWIREENTFKEQMQTPKLHRLSLCQPTQIKPEVFTQTYTHIHFILSCIPWIFMCL